MIRLGFEAVRSRGSHVFYRHADGRTTTLPYHAGRDSLGRILRETEVMPEELERELR